MDQQFNIKPLEVSDWLDLLPIIVLSCSGLISLLLATVKSQISKKLNYGVFFGGCLGALVCLMTSISSETRVILNGAFYIDEFSTIFSAILTAVVCLVAVFEISKSNEDFIGGEIYALLSFALVGMIGLVSSLDLIMMFICLELMSLSTYVLIAMRRTSKESSESSIKYFVMGGVMAAVLLMGISFIFGATGSFNLNEIKNVINSSESHKHVVLLFGMLLVYIALLFKVGAFPFHSWLPDVYSGASNTISAFMITAIKVTAFALLVRVTVMLWSPQLFGAGTKMYQLLYLAALLSFAFGSFVGISQNNLKRIFAYSSIAHTGFVLMALMSLNGDVNAEAFSAIFVYLLFYVIATFGAFGFLHMLKSDELKNYDLENLNGLYSRSPVIAICLTVFLLSMAGIPPTIGFFGKYYVILLAVKNGELLLATSAIISSIVAAYFYIRPITNMYFKDANSNSNDMYSEKFGIRALMIGASCLIVILPLFFNIL